MINVNTHLVLFFVEVFNFAASKASVFVIASYFHPSLTFLGKVPTLRVESSKDSFKIKPFCKKIRNKFLNTRLNVINFFTVVIYECL